MGNEKIIESIKIEDIDTSLNIRTDDNPVFEHVQGIAKSIQSLGQISPVKLVDRGENRTPRYECISGHLRIAACKLNGAKTVRAVVERAKDLSSAKRSAIRLAENMVRADLTPLEEARAISAMLLEDGATVATVAETTGISKQRIKDRLDLLKLPEDVRAKIQSGEVSAGAARQLARAPAMADQIEVGGKTVSELREEVSRKKAPQKQTSIDGGNESTARRAGRPKEMRSKAEVRERLASARAELVLEETRDDVARSDMLGYICEALEWVLCEREDL